MDIEQASGVASEVVIAGHSHIFAMGASQSYKGGVSLQPAAKFPDMFFLMEEWRGNRTREYWDALVNYAQGRVVVLIYNGNQHNAGFLFRAGPPFDFWDPDASADFLLDASVVPRAMVAEYFKPSLLNLDVIVAKLKEGGAAEIIVLGTPPCKGDSDFIREIVMGSRYFQDAAEKMGRDIRTVEINDSSVRVKLWRLLQQMMAEIAQRTGATFLPLPNDVLDPDGCLKREFWAHDVTHGNQKYGEVLVGHLRSALKLD